MMIISTCAERLRKPSFASFSRASFNSGVVLKVIEDCFMALKDAFELGFLPFLKNNVNISFR